MSAINIGLASKQLLAGFSVCALASVTAPAQAQQQVDSDTRATDEVDDIVVTAQKFLGTPYLWGGKTSLGLDCSALVQLSLEAAGMKCPRDSDMQEKALGDPVPLEKLQRGDLVFWKGHVAIAFDPETLIHANAFHMAVAMEPLAATIERIATLGTRVSSVKRLKRAGT